MSYGFVSFSDNGSLLVNSASPAYKYYGKFNPSSRSGNVNTYNISCPAYPLVFVEVPDGFAASVLSVTGGYTVQCLTDAPSAAIHVFIPTSGTATGTGTAVYDASGNLLFDSNQTPLSAVSINALNEGGSFTAPSGTNMIAYTGGHVKPEKTVTTSDWTYVGFDVGYEPTLVCNYVCEPDIFGGIWCSTQCTTEYVMVLYEYYVKIRTTNWYTYRSVARRSGNTYTFDWMLHESGYYKEPVEYLVLGYGIGTNVPPGWFTPFAGVYPASTFTGYNGYFTKDNTFPYTNSRYNMITASCVTARKEDHE